MAEKRNVFQDCRSLDEIARTAEWKAAERRIDERLAAGGDLTRIPLPAFKRRAEIQTKAEEYERQFNIWLEMREYEMAHGRGLDFDGARAVHYPLWAKQQARWFADLMAAAGYVRQMCVHENADNTLDKAFAC